METEMSKYQRSMVDTCFEEGHYQSGISVLDKLRSPSYKPSVAHIRQLIYISLYPPPAPQPKRVKALDNSPRKINAYRKQQQRIMAPNQEARTMALDLLNAFLLTNTPDALFRGIPSYVKEDTPPSANLDDPANDSQIGQEAMAVTWVKDCWSLLAPGFINDNSDNLGKEGGNTNTSFIGKYSWDTLHWMIGLFEKEARAAAANGKPAHSSILLSQIPQSPRGLPWDVTVPLNIVFESYGAKDLSEIYERHERIKIGMRLMNTLVDLTSPNPSLSPSHLVRLTSSRLPDLSTDSFREFLASIMPKHSSFKLALTCLYLANYSQGGSSEGFSGGSPMKKPQSSQAPSAPRRGRLRSSGPRSSGTAVPSTTPNSSIPYPIPPASSVLNVLGLPAQFNSSTCSDSMLSTPPPPSSTPDTSLKHALAKFHLISALGVLGIPNKVEDWKQAVEAGNLRMVVKKTFRGDLEGMQNQAEILGMEAVCMLLVEDWERTST